MRYAYAVFGAGVGKVIADYLCRVKSTCDVVLLDADFEKAKRACGMINKRKPHVHCRAIQCDSERVSRSFLAKFDAIISALPAKFNHALAYKAIDAGVNFCDLGGVVSVTERMIGELNEKAEKNCISVVPDCGIMPGLGIMLARTFVEVLDGVDTVCVYVGGIPQKPRPPLFYQKVFNIEGVESICYDSATVLKNGRIVEKKPFSDLENFKIKELSGFSPDGCGSVEAFITAGASIAHNTFYNLGVSNFCEKTVRWPGFVEFVSTIPRCEFVKKVSDVINMPTDGDNPDLLWMKVLVSGIKNREAINITATLLDFYDESTELTAMERCTGFPTGLIAKYLARHDAECGVKTPENAFQVYQLRQMREELKKYFNIKIAIEAA